MLISDWSSDVCASDLELQGNRAEIRIIGLQQRNSFIGNDTTSCFLRYMLANSLKANKCIKKYISLHRFRKGSAGNNLYPTGLRFCLCGQEITHAHMFFRIIDRHRHGRRKIIHPGGYISNNMCSVTSEYISPRVSVRVGNRSEEHTSELQ